MEYDEIEVVGVPLEEAIIQDFPRHPYKARLWPWTPTRYGKVSNWDQKYRDPPRIKNSGHDFLIGP